MRMISGSSGVEVGPFGDSLTDILGRAYVRAHYTVDHDTWRAGGNLDGPRK